MNHPSGTVERSAGDALVDLDHLAPIALAVSRGQPSQRAPSTLGDLMPPTAPSTDVTALASSLLEPIPAHRALGLTVQWAGDFRSEVSAHTPPQMANVIHSLHSSGLLALIDAAGLAAIIGGCQDDNQFEGVTSLGAAASLEFYQPARGQLLATCGLDRGTQKAVRPVLSGNKDRVRITTRVDITDESGAVVCRGRVHWSVCRTHRPIPRRRGFPDASESGDWDSCLPM